MLNLYHDSHILSYGIQTWHDGRLMHGIHVLMLVSTTLTLMQGHSGSAKAKIKCWIISTTKQTSIKLLAILYVALTLKRFIWLDHRVPVCSVPIPPAVTYVYSLTIGGIFNVRTNSGAHEGGSGTNNYETSLHKSRLGGPEKLSLALYRQVVEPGQFGLQFRHSNHWATSRPASVQDLLCFPVYDRLID